MSKTDIKIKINHILYENKGILQNNMLKLKTQDNETIKYDLKNKVLIKETHFERIELNFKEEVMKITLKPNKKELKQTIKVIEKEKKNNCEIRKYEIEHEKFKLEIKYN